MLVQTDTTLSTSIEANCVLIGACIPTLYPLLVKIFGVSALGGSSPFCPRGQRPPPSAAPHNLKAQQLHVLTIGSHSIRRKPVLDDLGSVDGKGNEGDEVVTHPGSAYSGIGGRKCDQEFYVV